MLKLYQEIVNALDTNLEVKVEGFLHFYHVFTGLFEEAAFFVGCIRRLAREGFLDLCIYTLDA